jgi:hypothetical protein
MWPRLVLAVIHEADEARLNRRLGRMIIVGISAVLGWAGCPDRHLPALG